MKALQDCGHFQQGLKYHPFSIPFLKISLVEIKNFNFQISYSIYQKNIQKKVFFRPFIGHITYPNILSNGLQAWLQEKLPQVIQRIESEHEHFPGEDQGINHYFWDE